MPDKRTRSFPLSRPLSLSLSLFLGSCLCLTLFTALLRHELRARAAVRSTLYNSRAACRTLNEMRIKALRVPEPPSPTSLPPLLPACARHLGRECLKCCTL